MARETKFELTNAVIVRDAKEKLQPMMMPAVFGVVGMFLLTLFMIFAGYIGGDAVMIFMVSLAVFGNICMILRLADLLIKLNRLEKGSFDLVTDEYLGVAEKTHISRDHKAIYYYATFRQHGECLLSNADPVSPGTSSEYGDEFWLVIIDTKIPFFKSSGPILLAYNKKRYEYQNR